MMLQLPLNIGLSDAASFANFTPTGNEVAYGALQNLLTHQTSNSCLYLWGATGTGKSHLLQASCHAVSQAQAVPAYLPLKQVFRNGIDLLEGLEHLDAVCIDDLGAIAGIRQWERALFELFNQLRDAQVPLIFSAHAPPQQLGLQLPDLVSRLTWGGVYALQSLNEAETVHALQKRAQDYGWTLPEEVARYLIKHCARDMPSLIAWLQRLDYASLAARHKITIPFVRQLLK